VVAQCAIIRGPVLHPFDHAYIGFTAIGPSEANPSTLCSLHCLWHVMQEPPARGDRSRSPRRNDFLAARKVLDRAECRLLLQAKRQASQAANVPLQRLMLLNESKTPLGALLKSISTLGIVDETATLRRAVETTSVYHMLRALDDACLASDTQENWSWLRANDLWVLLTTLKHLCGSARAGRPPRPEKDLLEYWLLSMDISWARDGGLHDIVLTVLPRCLHPKNELRWAKESICALILKLPFSTALGEK
jgi:hypothetical protein